MRTPNPRDDLRLSSTVIQNLLYRFLWYVFSAVHIMLLPSQKPSYYYSILKFVYVTSQLRHPLVVHPLLRENLDPPPAGLTPILACSKRSDCKDGAKKM